MPPITHHTAGMALLPGALYQGHKVEPRVLDLVSSTKANTVATVAAARKNFINAVKPDRVSPEQPVVFRYTGVNAIKPVDFYAYYDSGMEFQLTSGIVDNPIVRFVCYDPFCYEAHTAGAALTTSLSVVETDEVIRRINGTWYNVSTDFQHAVLALAKGTDGCIYIGGLFHDVGAATGDFIVKWNPFTAAISSLGTGMDVAEVYALAVAPNGDVYAGGGYGSAGGVATTNNIAFWDIDAGPAVWTTVGGGITAAGHSVRALAFDHLGNLYIGGDFHDQFDANGDNITMWSGAAYSSLGTGTDGIVRGIAVAPNGNVVLVGDFTHAGGVACAGIAIWNPTTATFSALGAGLTGGGTSGIAVVIDKAGNVIVGGDFTAADGVNCAYIAMWNGKTFVPLGSGFTGPCYVLKIDEITGLLYAGGAIMSAGGLTVTDRQLAIWNGTTWTRIDATYPAGTTVYAILVDRGELYVGYNAVGDSVTSYNNTVTNNGSATAYPAIKVKRVGGTYARLEWLKNETTGDVLMCDYSLLDGETITIDLTPGNRSIKSDFFGDVWRAVLRSSDLSSFNLLPGINNISVFVKPSGAPTITAWMEYPLTHWGADQVAV
jgi:hypothetical protein